MGNTLNKDGSTTVRDNEGFAFYRTAAPREPRQFTEADVKGVDFPTIYASYEELAHRPLPWQKRGLQQTASGYGAKLTSEYGIMFEGRLYRLYHTIYGNAGSVWFTRLGRKIYVN